MKIAYLPIFLILVACSGAARKEDVFVNVFLGGLGKRCGVVQTGDISPVGSVIHNNRRILSCIDQARKSETEFYFGEKRHLPPDTWVSSLFVRKENGRYVLLQHYEENDSGMQSFIGYCDDVNIDGLGRMEGVRCEYDESLQRDYNQSSPKSI